LINYCRIFQFQIAQQEMVLGGVAMSCHGM
jgi:hypothetical protein